MSVVQLLNSTSAPLVVVRIDDTRMLVLHDPDSLDGDPTGFLLGLHLLARRIGLDPTGGATWSPVSVRGRHRKTNEPLAPVDWVLQDWNAEARAVVTVARGPTHPAVALAVALVQHGAAVEADIPPEFFLTHDRYDDGY